MFFLPVLIFLDSDLFTKPLTSRLLRRRKFFTSYQSLSTNNDFAICCYTPASSHKSDY